MKTSVVAFLDSFDRLDLTAFPSCLAPCSSSLLLSIDRWLFGILRRSVIHRSWFSPLRARFKTKLACWLWQLVSVARWKDGSTSTSTACRRLSILCSFYCMLLLISMIWHIRSLSCFITCLILVYYFRSAGITRRPYIILNFDGINY